MSESEDRGELGGLARTIDALFTASAPTAATRSVPTEAREEIPTEPDPDEAVLPAERAPELHENVPAEARLDIGPVPDQEVVWSESPEPLEVSGQSLGLEVDGFLTGPEQEKAHHAGRIRAIGAGLRKSSTFDPIAAAVENLALSGGDRTDPAALAVAETLLSPAVTSRIVALLSVARDEARQAELRRVCVRLGHEMAVALSDALAETTDRRARHVCLEAMVEMGEAAMPVVETMLEDDRWFVVRNAVAVLGDVGGARAIEWVIGTLANSHGQVRTEALHALAKLGGDDAGQLAYGMLEDPDAEVRLAAAAACGELRVERAHRPLVKMLEDEKRDPDFIVAVLRALGQLADPGAVNAIEKHAVPTLFSKPRTDVRIAAYRALNHIGTPRARRLLNQAADDKVPEVRSLVREMLGIG